VGGTVRGCFPRKYDGIMAWDGHGMGIRQVNRIIILGDSKSAGSNQLQSEPRYLL